MNDSARKSVPKSAGMLTRSGPTGVSTSFCNSSWAIWASATISWQRSKYSRPASVSSTLRVVRLSRRSPTERSSSATWRDKVDLGMPRLAAARLKLCVLATSTKSSMPCKRFMAEFCHRGSRRIVPQME